MKTNSNDEKKESTCTCKVRWMVRWLGAGIFVTQGAPPSLDNLTAYKLESIIFENLDLTVYNMYVIKM